jgi:hypothetical protein
VESDLPKGYRGAAERSSNVGVPAFPLERIDAESGCPGGSVRNYVYCPRNCVLSPEFPAPGRLTRNYLYSPRNSARNSVYCPRNSEIYLRARRTQREMTWYQGVSSRETRVRRGWVMQDSFRGI